VFPRVDFPPLLLGEARKVQFDFSPFLSEGETIDSQECEARVWSGEDDSPEDILSRSATESDGVVSQIIQPTVTGPIYEVKCTAETSDGQSLILLGLLAVPPATDEEQDLQVPGGGDAVSQFDSGDISVEISPTPLITAAQNKNGGLFQINVYENLSIAAAAGVIYVYIKWYDRVTGALVTRIGAAVSATSINDPSESTFPADTAPNTQITIETDFSGVTGTPTYNVVAEVSRL